MKILSLFLSLLLISPALYSQTTASGVINSDQTWSKVDSPYIVEANVLVSTDVTLTIEAGVIIKFKDDTYLRIDGIIIAEGDEDNYIVFESFSEDAVKGSWEGIKLRSTSNTVINEDNEYVSGTKISYAKIKNASRGIYTYDNSVFISNSSFENNDKAIEIRATNKVVLIKSEFKENNIGIYSEYSDYSSGDDVNEIANTFIQKNHFSNNSSGINLNMNQRVFKNLKIQNNLFENNNTGLSFGGGGYGPRVADVTISNNVFNNKIGTIESVGLSVGQIYGGDSEFDEGGGSIKILHNLFKNAYLNYDYGGGVSGIDVKISNNIIDNSEGHDLVPAPYGIKISGGTSKSDTISNNYINSASYHLDLSDSYTDPSNKIFKANTLESAVESTPDNSIYSIGVFGSGHKFESNNFLSPFNEKQFINKGTDNVNANNNYWGTIDESVISGLIYDYYDDFELGEVDYSNFLSSKSIIAPVSTPVKVEKSTDQGNIKITWAANTESDIAGYKIYYGNYTGYSFSNSIDVGNVTEYTLDLPINYRDSTIGVTAYDTDLDGSNDLTDGNESWYSIAEPVITFYLADNGVTITCSEASIGETGIINGVEYTKRSKDQITTDNASTTCTSGITDMEGMFREKEEFNGDISHWDVSSVTKLTRMFSFAKAFNGDISTWDVSNVTDMGDMFNRAESFNQDISGWDVSNVTNMYVMFGCAVSFDQPLGNWNVSNVTNMDAMFACTPFNQDISGWDVSKVTIMKGMFDSNSKFNQDLSGWDVSSVTNMRDMFRYASSFNSDISAWNVSNVTTMSGMFIQATSFNQDISSWDVSSVSNMASMFNAAKSFNQPIGSWEVDSVSSMDFMFRGASTFNQDLKTWCTPLITSAPESFSTGSGLEESNLPIWDGCFDLFYKVKIDSMLSYGPEITVEIKTENISVEDSIKSFNFALTKPNGVTYKGYATDGTHSEDGLVQVAETDSSVLVGFASNGYMSGELPLIHLSFLDQDIVARDVHFKFTDFLYNNLVNYTEDVGLVGIVHNSGDVDSDGKIIAYDAAHALQYSVGLDPLPSQDPLPWEYWRIGTADVDFDGEILASDASDILKYSVGLISEFSPPVKGKAVVPQINVYASNKELRIESLGNGLFAMNLEFPILEGMSFGEPSAIENVLMASNMTDTLFKLAVASSSDLAGNFVSIPITNIKGDEVLNIDYYLNNTFGQVQVEMSSWLTSNEGVQNKPDQFELLQNYPNPFNPSTQIQYALPEATHVTLEVFNSVGQKVMDLINGQQSAGYHTATFDASGLSSGVYLYKLTTPSFTETKKMLLIK